MGIDIVHRFRSNAGIGHCLLHGLDGAIAGGMRIGDAITAQTVAIARQLGVDMGATRVGRFPFFEHKEAGAFS